MLLNRSQTSLQTNLHALYLVENLREFLHEEHAGLLRGCVTLTCEPTESEVWDAHLVCLLTMFLCPYVYSNSDPDWFLL